MMASACAGGPASCSISAIDSPPPRYASPRCAALTRLPDFAPILPHHHVVRIAVTAAIQPWTAYELTQQMRRILHYVWPKSESLLGAAGMFVADLVRLNVCTTDVDLLSQHYGVLASRLGAAGVAPTTTMIGVARLAIPTVIVEIEGGRRRVMRPRGLRQGCGLNRHE